MTRNRTPTRKKKCRRVQSSTRRGRITVVPFGDGDKMELANSSFSNLILTKSKIGENRNMMGFSVFTPGTNTSQKVHTQVEELAYVVRGSGKITMGEKFVPFRSGDSIYIPAGSVHGVRNDGEENVEMVFFFSSPEYPHTVDA